MHIAHLGRGILGASGIVGAGIGIATRAALSFKTRKESRVALAFFGDGAINEGLFHQSLNLAVLWSLPVIFLCENNGHAEFTPAAIHTASAGATARAAAYGVAAESVEGTDAVLVKRSRHGRRRRRSIPCVAVSARRGTSYPGPLRSGARGGVPAVFRANLQRLYGGG